MVRALNPNIAILGAAVAGLGPVSDQMVFLGGCATGLLITDPAASPIRATRDVDVVIEVASLAQYYRISESLGDRGFFEDRAEQSPICRWVGHGVLLDVMPTDPDILGFGSEWYERAFTAAQEHELPSGHTIRLISAPYFLITLSRDRDQARSTIRRCRARACSRHSAVHLSAMMAQSAPSRRGAHPARCPLFAQRFTSGLVHLR